MSADEIRQRTQGVWDKFYSLPQHLGTLQVREVAQVAARLRADLEALPADVRQHRHRHRQRAREPVGPVGAADREALPPALRGQADAGSPGTGVDHLLFVIGYWLLALSYWRLSYWVTTRANSFNSQCPMQ